MAINISLFSSLRGAQRRGNPSRQRNFSGLPRHRLRRLLATTILFLGLISCGQVETITNDFNPSTSTSTGPQTFAVVHVSDFTSTGILSTVGNLDDVFSDDIQTNITAPLPHTDVVLRTFLDKLYVINRLGRDSVQVVDPNDSFKTILEFSTGPGTNPHDIYVVSSSKAYITLYQPEASTGSQEILVVNPSTGDFIASIDLTPLTDNDSDRLARPERIIRVGSEIWVLLQDLDSTFTADTNGKIAVIDIATNTLKDVDPLLNGTQGIQLVGRNPADLVYHAGLGFVLVSMTGRFDNFATDLSDGFGGIEAVSAITYRSAGIAIDDQVLGGYPGRLIMRSSTQAFLIVESKRVLAFNPSTLAVDDEILYESPGTFLPDLAYNSDGHLLITERGDLQGRNAGLVILDVNDDFAKQGPLSVGGPPSSIAIVEVSN